MTSTAPFQVGGARNGPGNERLINQPSERLPTAFAPQATSKTESHPHPPGIINGGIISTLFDCHGNWTAAIALMDLHATPKPPLTLTYELLVSGEGGDGVGIHASDVLMLWVGGYRQILHRRVTAWCEIAVAWCLPAGQNLLQSHQVPPHTLRSHSRSRPRPASHWWSRAT